MTRFIKSIAFVLAFAALGWFVSWGVDSSAVGQVKPVLVGSGPQPSMEDQWRAFAAATRAPLPSDEAATAWRLRQLAVARAEAELDILRKHPEAFRGKQ